MAALPAPVQAPPARPAAATGAVTQIAGAVAAFDAGAGGRSQLTLRLQPAELGAVQIRISRGRDGAASVSVSVERPETLAVVQADVGRLHEALSRAGVPEQRSLSLHLMPPAEAGFAAGQGGAGGQPASQGGSQHGARQDRHGIQPPPPPPGAPAQDAAAPPPPRWVRAGVNITA